mmetsp:Transcript_10488/g.22408  ORF Transcript_10488/g.22408 Transcript_10488/m.22408 type:complete len:212 (-) Transcript_10488:308-943(-)
MPDTKHHRLQSPSIRRSRTPICPFWISLKDLQKASYSVPKSLRYLTASDARCWKVAQWTRATGALVGTAWPSISILYWGSRYCTSQTEDQSLRARMATSWLREYREKLVSVLGIDTSRGCAGTSAALQRSWIFWPKWTTSSRKSNMASFLSPLPVHWQISNVLRLQGSVYHVVVTAKLSSLSASSGSQARQPSVAWLKSITVSPKCTNESS